MKYIGTKFYIFYSDSISFQVTLHNLNYDIIPRTTNIAIDGENIAIDNKNVAIDDENIAIDAKNVAIEAALESLNSYHNTIQKAKTIFTYNGFDGIFGRSDVASITDSSTTTAGKLIATLKKAGLIEAVRGHGKGKYKFTST